MRLRRLLDFVVVDRNHVLDALREDRSSPLYRAEEHARRATGLLTDLLDAAQGLAHELPELDTRAFRESLTRGRSALPAVDSPDQLSSVGSDLCGRVRRYAQQQSALLKEREAEVQRILGLVSGSLRHSATSTQQVASHAEEAVANIEQVARLDDLREIREGLARNLDTLRDTVTRARAEAEASQLLLDEVEQLRTRVSEAEEAARRDPLTGIYNRRGFDERLAALVRSGEPFSLVLADVNQFKEINDEHGHSTGDECLKAMAAELVSVFRLEDLVARIGGDEFAVLAAHLTAEQIAVRLQTAFSPGNPRSFRRSSYEALAEGIESFTLSASFGVVSSWPGAAAEALYQIADTHLYSAKRRGDNCIVT